MVDIDPWLPARLRADIELVRAEQLIEAAVRRAVEQWLKAVREVVLGEGDGGLSAAASPPPEPEQWPAAEPVWVLAMEQLVLPAIADLFSERFLAVARVAVDAAQPYIEAYIDEVASRLVLFPASAFEELRPELAEAYSEGETLDQIRSRIESILDFDTAADAPGTADHDRTKRLRAQIRAIERKLDTDSSLTGEQVSVLRDTRRELYEDLHETERRWQWKARRIARTETIGAYNGGAFEGAVFRADVLGVPMAKRWLATLDTRVRPTHLAAHGQLARLTGEFEVGDASLRFPGDPLGPGHEVINCRCTFLVEDVEDLADDERAVLDSPPADLATISAAARPKEDPLALTAASGDPYTGGMIALVPSPADIERLAVPDGELPEDLHLTLLFLGKGADIEPETRQAIVERLAGHVAEGAGPIEANGFALSAFNPAADADTCLVLGVGGAGLDAIHSATDALVRAVFEPPEQHAPWVPHITLTYTDDLGQIAQLADRTGPVVFDRLRVAFGDDITDIPLQEESAMPDDKPDGQDDRELPNGWRGRLAPLDTRTGDGRILSTPPDGLRMRQPPLSLLWKEALGGAGHDGAVVVGRMDRVWLERGEDGLTYLAAEGPYDLAGQNGAEAARLHGDGMFNGVSVDLDDMRFETRWYSTETGLPVDVDTMGEDAFYEAWDAGRIEPVDVALDWRLMGATLTPQPAFNEARVEPVWDYVPGGEVLTASGAAARVYDPADFTDPALPELTPLTVGEAGRVYGHLAPWGTCHTGFPGQCVTAPHSATDYALFHVGAVQTGTGPLGVGKITLGTGHADPSYGVRAASEHYDHTGTAVAVVRAGEDAYGIWVAGWLLDDVTPEQVEILMRSPLSGDWRKVDGNLELVGALAVNVPGFPIPRTLAASGDLGEQVTLVAAGAPAMARLRRARRRAAEPDGGIDYRRLAAAIVAEQNAVLQRGRRADDLAARLSPAAADDHAARLARLDERIA